MAKKFSYIAGEKGRNRVRAFEEVKTGMLYLEWHERGKRRRKSLGHRDEDRAKRQAEKVAYQIGEARWKPSAEITLGELFDIYLVEESPQKGEGKRKHDHRCAEMFNRFFGRNRKAQTLNQRDWSGFIQQRRCGKIAPPRSTPGQEVVMRTVIYDLKFLRAALAWATRSRNGSGQALLPQNPVQGFVLPKEDSPSRPRTSHMRYEKMLEAAADMDWRFRVALVLAHETGHRAHSIRHLQWRDIDGERITWRAEHDKIGFEHVTPITPEAQKALQAARTEQPGVGQAWVLPAPQDATRPCSRHLLRTWWRRAEELAGLEHVDRLGWHGLRRKFGDELRELPMKDLCHLGGWKDAQTVLTCYQQPDEETQRQALQHRRRALAGGV